MEAAVGRLTDSIAAIFAPMLNTTKEELLGEEAHTVPTSAVPDQAAEKKPAQPKRAKGKK